MGVIHNGRCIRYHDYKLEGHNMYYDQPFFQHDCGQYPFYPNSWNNFHIPYYQWFPKQHFASSSPGPVLKDFGPRPFVINISMATRQNENFRTALWTGEHFQITLMSLHPGEDIGLEMHPDVDQFLRIEQGMGMVRMGEQKEDLNFIRPVQKDDTVVIPAGTWHNLINTGPIPLKLYSIYAPPNHPQGTVHPTKASAQAAEEHGGY